MEDLVLEPAHEVFEHEGTFVDVAFGFELIEQLPEGGGHLSGLRWVPYIRFEQNVSRGGVNTQLMNGNWRRGGLDWGLSQADISHSCTSTDSLYICRTINSEMECSNERTKRGTPFGVETRGEPFSTWTRADITFV